MSPCGDRCHGKEYLAAHPELIDEAKQIIEHGAGRASSESVLPGLVTLYVNL